MGDILHVCPCPAALARDGGLALWFNHRPRSTPAPPPPAIRTARRTCARPVPLASAVNNVPVHTFEFIHYDGFNTMSDMIRRQYVAYVRIGSKTAAHICKFTWRMNNNQSGWATRIHSPMICTRHTWASFRQRVHVLPMVPTYCGGVGMSLSRRNSFCGCWGRTGHR